MSDESSVEKFVLTYEANTAETLKRLEELSEKLDEVHDKNKKGNEEGKGKWDKMKNGVKSVTGELEQLVPGLNKAGNMVDMVGKKFVIATVALAAFAVVMKSIRDLQAEYEKQRITGSITGLSASQVNMYQQQFNSANGRMTGDKSRDLLGKVSNITSAAYTNPDPYNREMLQLKNAGVNGAFDQHGRIKSTDQVLNEMTKKFRSVSKEQAEAIGMSIGLTMDETKAIRDRNDAMNNSLSISESAKIRQANANAAMEQLGESSGHLSERWRQISDTVAQEFIPVIASAVKYIDEITEGLPEALDHALESFHKFDSQFQSMMEFAQEMPLHITNLGEFWDKKMKEADDRSAAQIAAGKKAAEEQNNASQQGYKTQKEFERNVNLFASSVGSFAGVIDERQAWAAWAGSVGQAGGVSGLGRGQAGVARDSGGGNGGQFGGYGTGNEQTVDTYDDMLKQVWGDDWKVGKAIMMVESSGNPNAKNPTSTASGLMQNIKMNWKDGEDPFDPLTSIRQGKRTFDWAKSVSGGDMDKAIMRYGENTPEYLNKVKKYIPRTIDSTNPASTPNLSPQSIVNNNNSNTNQTINYGRPAPMIHAESRETAQMSMVADNVAGLIGVTKQQLLQGNVRKSDISYAVRNMEFEAQKNVQIAQAKANAPMLRQGDRAAAAQALRTSQDQLKQIQTYGKTLIARGTGLETDARQFTQDRPDKAGMVVNVNIYGVHDANEFKRDAIDPLKQGIKDATNHYADGVSH
ncbi:lytic transglycosylase domain-containing protein [Citrobacter sp.]|uniref:lytic transglycosylase domain-containing protein n=1 Tax=Citrobacter sp. TaxID=1896336 RepID=UPI002FC8783E